MLRKIEEHYEHGNLVEEVFSNSNEYRMSAEGIKVTSKYKTLAVKERQIVLVEEDEAFFRKLESKWKKGAKSLAGYIAHGHAFCGCIGATYYPPFSDEGIRLNKEEYSDNFERDKNAGIVSKRFRDGNLEADIERFEAIVYKEDAALVIKFPLVEVFEAFQTYAKRKHLYPKR